MAEIQLGYTAAQINNVIGNALLKSEAQNTYLTQANAASTYALKTDLTLDTNNNTFTTDEVQVGTWMGSPLYRQCYAGSISGSISEYLYIMDWPTTKEIVKIDQTIVIPGIGTISNGDYCHIGLRNNNKIFLRQDYTTGSFTYQYKLIIYYIKI